MTVRRVTTREDELESLARYNEVVPRRAVTIDEVDSFKTSAIDHADFLVDVDGQRAGSAFAAVLPQRPRVCLALVTVLAERRGRGAGTLLYKALSDWCRESGVETIDAQVEEEDDASLAWAARRGFVEIERNKGMELELAAIDPSPIGLPAGIEIVQWAARPDLSRGIYEVALEAYADVPGTEDDEMEPFEDWLAHDMQGSGDRPETTFLALAGDEVVGYAKLALTAAQTSVAFHAMTGVKRAWRGRGIAGALKRAQIRWAKDQGYERMVTGNEMRNEPIRRLNRSLGYREAPGRVLMRGPLAPA